MDYTIRAADVEDSKDLARMIMELAEYEKISDRMTVTQKVVEEDGFCKNPFFHGIIAEVPEQHRTKEGHTKIGYAMYNYSYETSKGRTVFMMELYVMPEFRGKGIGKALMSKVAQLGVAVGCNLFSFIVVDCNKSALDFYFKQGCVDATTHLGYRFFVCSGEDLEQLAQP